MERLAQEASRGVLECTFQPLCVHRIIHLKCSHIRELGLMSLISLITPGTEILPYLKFPNIFDID